jgi:hypothetical protein
MAAGDFGSVQSRSRHQNGDTHVGLGDDVFSDAGSTPAASTNFPQEIGHLRVVFPPPPLFLHDFDGHSSISLRPGLQKSNRGIEGGRAQMHVALCRGQVLVSSQFLNWPVLAHPAC